MVKSNKRVPLFFFQQQCLSLQSKNNQRKHMPRAPPSGHYIKHKRTYIRLLTQAYSPLWWKWRFENQKNENSCRFSNI